MIPENTTKYQILPRMPWPLLPQRSVGDIVYFHVPGVFSPEGHPVLVKGVVEAIWKEDWHPHANYICRVLDPDMIQYEVRDDFTVTTDPMKPPAFVQTRITTPKNKAPSFTIGFN